MEGELTWLFISPVSLACGNNVATSGLQDYATPDETIHFTILTLGSINILKKVNQISALCV